VEKCRRDPCLGERRIGDDVRIAGTLFADVLEHKPGVEEQCQPGVQWSMDLMKRERYAVTLDLVKRPLDVEVAASKRGVAA